MPDAAAVERTIRGALEDARAKPEDVGLWFPSRNGVEEMDRVEAEVARTVFGTPPRALAVKEAIGEMAAAGGGQLVAACRAVADPASPLPAGRRRALVNSFGAGGNFLAAVIEAVNGSAEHA